MSEFKFSCPNCQQNIAATSEYSGAQIMCPACNTPLVVPAAPDSPPPAHGSKLSMAPSTTSHAATGTAFVSQGPPTRRKKKRTGLYAGLAAGGCGILGVIIFWHPLDELGRSTYTKYIHHDVVALEQAPTNVPPPPPPDLATEDILQNVADTYKGLTNYAVKGLSVAVIDISAIKAGQPKQNSTEGVSLELGRTNLYRLEWELKTSGAPFKGVAWSAGKGDFVGYGPYPAAKAKNRETALATASAASEAQCIALAQLFFDDTNSVARQAAAFAKTNGPNLATRINGRNCYVLDGEFAAHDLVLWIDKESFLIPQIQFVFGGKLDETTLKGMPPAEKNQLMTWAKLKGTITETYQNPDVNQDLTASAFDTEFAPTLTPEMQQAGPGRAKREPTRGASSPTQLTRRLRPDQGQ
ncbi:MAG TPA: hypothetical protein VMR33_14445 [Candidatus Baltobacteraceae bacterium]|jgi:hypothetical protein|nr:hypothetical protein [Candidatus Baltobacteraceae bacterium]